MRRFRADKRAAPLQPLRKHNAGARTRPRPARLALAGAAALALALGLFALGSGTPRVAAESGLAELTPSTDLAVPAEKVVMLGASTSEPGAPGGATWGLGELRGSVQSTLALVRYTAGSAGEEGGWQPGPELPAGFKPDHPNGKPSPLEGQITPEGYGALVGTIPHGQEPQQVVLVRKPGTGEAFQATPPVPGAGEAKEKKGEGKEGEAKGEGSEEPLLQTGQALFGSDRAPMIAPLAEGDGAAGVLVAPTNPSEGLAEAVLHWNGQRWAREPIEIPKASAEEKEFNLLAIAASGPENAWLLARLSKAYGSGAVALFRRVKDATGEETGSEKTGDGYSWKQVEVEVGGAAQLQLGVPVSGGGPAKAFRISGAENPSPITVESQLLTVTSEGLWVDGVRADVEHQQPFTTMYLRPQGERAVIEGSWCKAPAGAPACLETLPQEPPQQYGRSIAWSPSAAGAGSSPYGARIISGLAEGVTLRLKQSGEFAPVRSIGGGSSPEAVPGQLYGAAFSSPNEGWLGFQPPVHLSNAAEPYGFEYWPVATRHPLVAIAPEPGAPVAARTSEAIAVGESGGVARYKPGAGWLPESLFGPGERIEEPYLRAVAWPRANRIYAVGEKGAMWLWRGETGLWEPDPATPINFRANLYGVAFDPENPSRGYAVGEQALGHGGVILRYGKTWSEETQLPEEARNAQFTGIAFAGSEALVAYNYQPNPDENSFAGGLLVNDGGGWSVDREEQQATGSAQVDAVAGLPDGGAAVLATHEGIARLYERESATAPWHQAANQLPSGVAGSLALYRQNGALRALLSTGGAASEANAIGYEPPPGFPPYEAPTATIDSGGGAVSGVVLRQTPSGWRDESHSSNPVTESDTNYGGYDEPYHPDGLIAALVSPSGSEAWIVGGDTGEPQEQTADIARYPASERPPNEETGQVPVQSEEPPPAGQGVTTLAFGGDASCEDPCMDRAGTDTETEKTGIGPEVWLTKAVSLAKQARAAAFFYTGPLVHYSSYSGPVPPRPAYGEEYERYARIFSAGLSSGLPAYAGSSQGEGEGEAALAGAFAELATPLGTAAAGGFGPAGSEPSRSEREGCGCADDYYAVQNAHMVVVMLDQSGAGGVDAAQRAWLEQELQYAGTNAKPAIVVGEADLGAQLAPGKHEAAAEALVAALTGRDPDGQDPGGYAASAYFYDAPEENVSKTISFDGASLRAFGSGTLGYENAFRENNAEFHGAKGMMLGEVQWSARDQTTDVAPVQARLVPLIGELAMEPDSGTLLRRSHVSLVRGLARRPRAGCRGVSGQQSVCTEDQYVPIPSLCVGTSCAEAVLPEYEFRSSEPAVGGFVKINTAAGGPEKLESEKGEPTAFVLLNAKGQPVADGHEQNGEQVGATSGLFCAYNAGETKVTISAGGLSYTLPVRVQAGSVREPCGTVPLRHLPVPSQAPTAPAPPPAPAPAPAGPAPAGAPPVVPAPPPPAVPAVPAVPAPAARPTHAPPPFFPLPVLATPLLAFVPPPVPTPARPTPPTGTSAVTSPVEAVEREEEEEEAPESVSNQALAYDASEHEPSPAYILGIVLLAALAGAVSVRGRPRRGRRELRVAPATLSSARSQRRLASARRRPW